MTEQQPLHTSLEDPDQVPEIWRDEVQARLDRYKRRRGRRIEGAFTMRFPFPPDEPVLVKSAGAVGAHVLEVEEPEEAATHADSADQTSVGAPTPIESTESGNSDLEQAAAEAELLLCESAAEPESGAVESAPEHEETLSPIIEMPPRPKPRRKVIAFPAPSYLQQEAMRRIADPVQPEQLRILDVPEELQAIPATPFLEGLLDAPAASAPAPRADFVELPCPAVRTATRLGTALIDTIVVLAGMAMLVAVANRFMADGLPPAKFLIAGGLAVAVLLWASYQYLFLVYGGRTLGMRLMRVGLRTFKGRGLTLPQRRSRVVALYLSVLSLGMGVLWALVDADGLCWHDRISQTFPAANGKS